MNLNDQYEEIIRPDNLVKNFKTDEEFREFCKEGSVVDLNTMRQAFEEYELYEHLVIIRDVITEKSNNLINE